LWLDGCSWDGQAARAFDIASRHFNTGAAQVSGGVLPSGGGMAVTAGSGMSVNVATGYFVAASSAGSTYGGYLGAQMSAASGLTVATSDPANPRIDGVFAYVADLGTSSSDAYVEVLTGTPASGATLANLTGKPAAPSNAVPLAWVLVPASSTSVSSGNIGAASLYAVAQGGILPAAALTAPAGYTGMYLHDLTSGTLKHNPASGPVQAKVLPWPTQAGFYSPSGTYHGGTETYITVTITVDGNTDIDIYCGLDKFVNGDFGFAVLAADIDTTRVWSHCITNGPGVQAGGSFCHRTSSGSDRPAAGTHTVSLLYSDNVGASTPTSFGTFEMRVSAAVL
jgi:hypothetical protein